MGILDNVDMVVGILDTSKGRDVGRTAMQKLLYLSSHKVDCIDDFDFKAHLYGPYSREVTSLLHSLVSCDIINEQICDRISDSFVYTLAKDGQYKADRLRRVLPDDYESIKSVVDGCDRICELKAELLSCAARAHFVINTKSAIKTDYGWNMSIDDMDKGIEILSAISLTP